MQTPVADVVTANPHIKRIWCRTSEGWRGWYEGRGSLATLKSGSMLWVYHTSPTPLYYRGGYYPLNKDRMWTRLDWEGGIEFTPGKQLTTTWWDFCLDKLREVGLHPLPWLCGVRWVEVVPQLPYPYNEQNDYATVWSSERKILVKDSAPLPTTVFPATILHESAHMWEALNLYNASENLGYSMTWLFHLLQGDEVDVFSGRLYPGATAVAKSTRSSPEP